MINIVLTYVLFLISPDSDEEYVYAKMILKIFEGVFCLLTCLMGLEGDLLKNDNIMMLG